MPSHRNNRAHKKWTDLEGDIVKAHQRADIQKFIDRFKSSALPVNIVADFQDLVVKALHSRMKADQLGYHASIRINVPRTLFYGHVCPRLEQRHFWSAHYGDWSAVSFRTRLIGRLSSITGLKRVFGDLFVSAVTQVLTFIIVKSTGRSIRL